MSVNLRLGTRGSALALRQAEIVREALTRVRPDVNVETVVIKTSGDWTPEQGENPLDRKGGGKALFAKEIEEALLDGRIDAAVHSMKDMESVLPEGLSIPCMLPREDVRDAVILKTKNDEIKSLADLPVGCVIGTCSLRRQGFLLSSRPDLKVETLRGNVGTRLEKLQAGNLAGILLAKAGLNRLNLDNNVSFLLPVEEMLPAVGQGAIGIEIKEKSESLLPIFSQINCPDTLARVNCERAALAALGGSCHTPIGAYAVLDNGGLWLRLCLVSPDGQERYEEEGRVAVGEGFELGRELGLKLKTKAPPELL
jgi:hydroxymethylbilane synthase